ncbi:MAG: hypothetical protein ACR2GG_11670, partial [Gemmatimonadaceae bacterium]
MRGVRFTAVRFNGARAIPRNPRVTIDACYNTHRSRQVSTSTTKAASSALQYTISSYLYTSFYSRSRRSRCFYRFNPPVGEQRTDAGPRPADVRPGMIDLGRDTPRVIGGPPQVCGLMLEGMRREARPGALDGTGEDVIAPVRQLQLRLQGGRHCGPAEALPQGEVAPIRGRRRTPEVLDSGSISVIGSEPTSTWACASNDARSASNAPGSFRSAPAAAASSRHAGASAAVSSLYSNGWYTR